MDHSNSAIIRKAYEDFAQGNIPAVFAAFDQTITWHVPGHSPLSGDYSGHDQIGDFFRRTMELSGGALKPEARYGNPSHAVRHQNLSDATSLR